MYRECAETKYNDTTWFQLDPIQSYFYHKKHGTQLQLPSLSESCRGNDKANQVAIVYPTSGSEIVVPRGLGGEIEMIQLQAVAGDSAELFWHLDEVFLGTTRNMHEMTIELSEGAHTLTVIDQHGNIAKCRFKVYQG